MAKKDKSDLGDFDLDEFNEFDDFGTGEPVPDNRRPTVKVGAGILSGMKDEAKSPAFYKTILKSALPTTYQSVWDSVDDVASEGMGLYNELKQEIRPATRQLKRFLRFVKPTVEPVLPKWLSSKIDDKIAADGASSASAGMTEEQINDAQISSELAQIFKAQAEADTEDRAKDTMRDMIETKRHEINASQRAGSQHLLAELVSYQNNITNAWQKKTLELNYRSYFSLRDMLKLQRASSEDSLTLLKNIAKNTGLPDFVKLNADEALAQTFREALTGKIQESVVNGLGPFVKQFTKNIGAVAKETLRDVTTNVQQVVELEETISNLKRDSTDMGADGDVVVGEMVGGMLSQVIAGFIGKQINPILEKNKEFVGRGHALGRMRDEIPNYFRDMKNKPTEDFGWWGGIVDSFKRAIPGDGRSKEVAQDNISNLTSPAIFTNKANITLVDIIPGILSRLLQSSEGIRTGELPDLAVWDWEKRTFSDFSSMRRKIAKKILPKWSMESRESTANAMLDNLGVEGLTDSQKDTFKAFLLEQSSKQRSFNVKDFTNAGNYAKHGSNEDSIALARHVAKQVGLDKDGNTPYEDTVSQKRRTHLGSTYRSLHQADHGTVAASTLQYNLGYQDIVRSLGLTDYEHGRESINDHKVNDVYKNYRDKGQDYEKVIDALLGIRGVDDSSDIGGRDVRSGAAPMVGPIPPTTGASETPEKEGKKSFIEMIREWNSPKLKHVSTEQAVQQSTRAKAEEVESELETQIDRVIDAISQASVKAESVTSLQTLQDILTAVMNIGVEGNGGGDGTGVAPKKRGIFGRGIRGVGRGIRYAAVKGWRANRAMLGLGFKTAKAVVKAPLTAAKWLGNNLFGRIMDISVPGSKENPVITAAGLRAGEYFDALTNDPIKSIDDIKGAVVRTVNGVTEQVLSLAQFNAGLYDSNWKKVSTGLKRHLGTAARFAGSALGMAFKPLKIGLDLAKSVFNYAFGAPDVFVPGEPSPRLIGKLIDSGDTYFGTDQKPITSIADIKSDIFHRDDFTKPVLYYTEFQKGVVKYDGKPIKTNSEKIGDIVKLPFRLAKKALGKMKDGASWLLEKVGGLFSGALGGLGGMFNGMGKGGHVKPSAHYQIENINVLKQIYNLLCQKFELGTPMEMTPDVGGPSGKGGGKGLFRRMGQGWKVGRRKWKRSADKRNAIKADISRRKQEAYESVKGMAKARLAEAGITDESIKTFRTNHGLTTEDMKARRDEAVEKAKDKLGIVGSFKDAADGLKFKLKRKMTKDEKAKDGKFTNLDRLKSLAGGLKDSVKNSKVGKSIGERVSDRLDAAGKRTNSWKDILAKRAAAKAAKRATGTPTADAPKKEGGGLLAAVMAVVSVCGGIWSSVKSIGGLLGGFFAAKKTMDAAGGVADALGDIGGKGGKEAAKNAGKKGLARRAAGALGRGLMWTGTRAIPAILQGAWWAASGLASVVSAPVLLGAAAVAGVAIAGYYTYKYFAGKIGLLNQLRMAQYGVSPEFKDACTQIGEVERYLKPMVQYDGKKPTNIAMNKETSERVLEILGTDKSNSDKMYEFSQWFDRRFKPVFLSNLGAMEIHNVKGDLVDADTNVPDAEKILFAKRTMLSTGVFGPYYTSANVFVDAPVTPGVGLIEKIMLEITQKFDPAKAKEKIKQIGNVPTVDTRSREERDKAAMDARIQQYKTPQKNVLGSQAAAYVQQQQEAAAVAKVSQPNSPMLPAEAKKTKPRTMADIASQLEGELGASQAGEGTYASIPRPKGNGYSNVAPTITAAAEAIGLDAKLALSVAGIESSFKTMAKSRSSSAAGLFQFIDDTWKEQMLAHGPRLGIPANATQFDPVANSLLGAAYLRSNKESLEKSTGKQIGDTELYLAHFLGLGGARKFLSADPNEKAAKVLPSASSSNVPIFFEGARPRTISEVHDVMRAKVQKSNSNVMKRTDSIYVDEQKEEDPKAKQAQQAAIDAAPQLTTKDIPGYGAKADASTRSLLERSTMSQAAADRQASEEVVVAPAPVEAPRVSARAAVANKVEQQAAQRQQQAVTQQLTHSKSSVELQTTANALLQSSLDVQTKMESHLSKLLALASATPAAEKTSPKPTSAPRPPVSMQRQS